MLVRKERNSSTAHQPDRGNPIGVRSLPTTKRSIGGGLFRPKPTGNSKHQSQVPTLYKWYDQGSKIVLFFRLCLMPNHRQDPFNEHSTHSSHCVGCRSAFDGNPTSIRFVGTEAQAH
jgi:hypothetical protein